MTAFRLLRPFNDARLQRYARSTAHIGDSFLPHFAADTLTDRLVRALAAEYALPTKEIAEAFEFFAVARKYLRRAPSIVDLCCGHGLAGLLFAVFERRTEEVLLCDRKRPVHFERVWRACTSVAPWVAAKARYVEGELEGIRAELPVGSAVLGVHACGRLSDACIETAVELGGPVALMPCCRERAHNPAPQGLREALGATVAHDVERTYALERAGLRVRWREIPAAITPMNRVLIGVPR